MPPLIVTKRQRGKFAYSRLRKGCSYFMSYSGGPDIAWKHMYRTPSQYPDGERVEIDRMLAGMRLVQCGLEIRRGIQECRHI